VRYKGKRGWADALSDASLDSIRQNYLEFFPIPQPSDPQGADAPQVPGHA